MGLELVAAAVQRAVVGKPGTVSFSISIFQSAIFISCKGNIPNKIWKSLIAFDMKGGGGLACQKRFFSKMFVCKNHLESFSDCQNVFCT